MGATFIPDRLHFFCLTGSLLFLAASFDPSACGAALPSLILAFCSNPFCLGIFAHPWPPPCSPRWPPTPRSSGPFQSYVSGFFYCCHALRHANGKPRVTSGDTNCDQEGPNHPEPRNLACQDDTQQRESFPNSSKHWPSSSLQR